jgi:hypothetical protein
MKTHRRTLLLTALVAAAVAAPAARADPDWSGSHALDAAGELAAGLVGGTAPPGSFPLGYVAPCPAEPSPTGNVQVNCRAQDGTSLQNTQSETSAAVTGDKVVVGYNDSLVCCLPAVDVSGYSVSTDGGRSFIDMGTVPEAPGVLPLGDPSLAADGAGNFYYATLALSSRGQGAHSLVAIYEMPFGSNRFQLLSVLDVGSGKVFFADKEYLAIGADGSGRTHYYLSYTLFGGAYPGFPIVLADSVDGVHWRSTLVSDPAACDEGSVPVPAGAEVHIAYLQFNSCGGDMFARGGSERMATVDVASGAVERVTGIGEYKGSGDRLADCGIGGLREVIETAPGHDVRNIELPGVTRSANGTLYAVWDDRPNGIGGDVTNATRIYLSYSLDDNRTWSAPKAISPAPSTATMNDRFQPSLTVDGDGLHALWYERVAASPVDLIRADKEDLTLATSRKAPASQGESPLSTVAFPVVQTNPNQDPAFGSGCYMGDYNTITTNGTTRFATWGDNRNVVPIPSGFENEPDVFLASY